MGTIDTQYSFRTRFAKHIATSGVMISLSLL